MKTKEDFINNIVVDKDNLEYIAKTGKINGSLLVSFKNAMDDYAKEYHKEHRVKTIEKDCTCYVEPFEMMHDPKCVMHGNK